MIRTLTRSLQRFSAVSKYNEHQSITKLHSFVPQIGGGAWVSSSATVVGEVFIDDHCLVFPGVVIRGDMNEVCIRMSVAIMPNCSLYTTPAIIDSGEISNLNIEPYTIVMPNCTLISCKLEENTFIGSNSVICEGAIVSKGSMIGPNSVIPPSRVIPAGQLWAGNPVKFIKEVERPERAANLARINFMSRWSVAYKGDDDLPPSAYLEYEAIQKKMEEEIEAEEKKTEQLKNEPQENQEGQNQKAY